MAPARKAPGPPLPARRRGPGASRMWVDELGDFERLYQPDDARCLNPLGDLSMRTIDDWHNELDDVDYPLHLRVVHGRCARAAPGYTAESLAAETIRLGKEPHHKLMFCSLDEDHEDECAPSWMGGV